MAAAASLQGRQAEPAAQGQVVELDTGHVGGGAGGAAGHHQAGVAVDGHLGEERWLCSAAKQKIRPRNLKIRL